MKTSKIGRKLKIEKFLKDVLWQYVLFIATIFFFAWLFNKPCEATMFSIAHIVIRPKFDKQYHCKTTCLCTMTTLSVIFLGIYVAVPVKYSLLSTLPIAYFVCWVGYLAQDRIDCLKTIKELQFKTIWQMTETELAEYCYAKGIRGDMLEFVIMVVVYNMKYREIAHKLNYAVDTLKDWSPKCKQKLNIKSWKK